MNKAGVFLTLKKKCALTQTPLSARRFYMALQSSLGRKKTDPK